MTAFLAALAAGLLTGVGIGGGTVLLVYLTQVAGMVLREAQGINLLYFLLTAPFALWGHLKNDLVDKPLALRAGAAGLVTAAAAAWLSRGLDTALLQKFFGGFTILVGLREIFCKKQD